MSAFALTARTHADERSVLYAESGQLARTAFHAELPLETFECKPCGVAVTAEAVSGTHMLIEKRHFY